MDHCQQCRGRCCKSTVVDSDGKYRTQLFKADHVAIRVQPKQEWGSADSKTTSCVFLHPEDHTCTTYEDRPIVCRTYPYYPILVGERVRIGVAIAPWCGLGKETVERRDKAAATNVRDFILTNLSMDEIKAWSDSVLGAYEHIEIVL